MKVNVKIRFGDFRMLVRLKIAWYALFGYSVTFNGANIENPIEVSQALTDILKATGVE